MKIHQLLVAVFVFAGLALASQTASAAYSKDYIGEIEEYDAAFEDTLIHLARRNGLGYVELRAANPSLDPWIPGAGADIILPTQHILPNAPRKGIVINLAEMRVYYYKDPNEAPQTYPISIGREGLSTPTGQTTIVRKKDGPTWRPTDRMREEDPTLPAVVPPGPDNPLGTHALYLGFPQYLLHGTNKPYGVGRRVSSGCIRLYPEHIKALFPQVPVGTQVTIIDQPVKVGWIGQDLFMEVSPTQDQSALIETNGNMPSYEISAEDMRLINEKAVIHKDRINWDTVAQAVKEHAGVPVNIFAAPESNSRLRNAGASIDLLTTDRPMAENADVAMENIIEDPRFARRTN